MYDPFLIICWGIVLVSGLLLVRNHQLPDDDTEEDDILDNTPDLLIMSMPASIVPPGMVFNLTQRAWPDESHARVIAREILDV